MRTILGSAILAGTVAGMLTMGAPEAVASGWTLTNGGSFTATSGNARFTLGGSSQPLSCSSSTVHGTAPTGSGLPGSGSVSITDGTFSGCTGGLGSTGTATLGPAAVNLISYAAGTDSVSATITGIHLTLTLHDLLGNCTATVTGELDTVNYSNPTSVATIAADSVPKQSITSATGSGCAGLVRAGDKVAFSATYRVTPAITIRPDGPQ